MALVKGTNSYVTVAEADAYFGDRLNAAAWTAASAGDKEKALVTATTLVDQNTFAGEALLDTQLLAFPRVGSYFEPLRGKPSLMNPVPQRLIKAVFEQAIHLLENTDTLSSSSTIDEVTVGPISIKGIKNASKMTSSVRNVLQPLLVAGGNTWWRAN